MNEIEYIICKRQAKIFSIAASEGYEMAAFTNLFMNSYFCTRQLDSDYSRYQFMDAGESWEVLYQEIKKELVQYSEDMCFDSNVAAWIGFTYRQLYFETSLTSPEILDRIPFEKMAGMYMGYHTLGMEMSGERMRECFRLPAKKRKPDKNAGH